MPEDSKWKFEYYTDAQILWSTEVYTIGDTIAFTTRKQRKKVKEETASLMEENAALKAARQLSKDAIQKALLDY